MDVLFHPPQEASSGLQSGAFTYSLLTQNDLLLKNLERFYSDVANLEIVTHIISGKSKISLRIIDWFVTNYAKKNFTSYTLKTGSRFNVYNSYKLNLKGYYKIRFDPFCRWDRISIPYVDGKQIETTIGQLKFFKWIIENELITYIERHYDEIDRDMNERNSTSKSNKEKKRQVNPNAKTRKKREELSAFAGKGVKKEVIDTVITF